MTASASSGPPAPSGPLRVTIVGGHGQIAQHLERQLAQAGHEVLGTHRRPEQAADLEANGATPVLIDLENTSVEAMAEAIEGSDAVVFAAGGGADGNKERKETVDKGAAIMLADAAERAGVRRYLMVSAMGLDRIKPEDDPEGQEVFQVYLRAKLAADEDLAARDLDWTIVRPGRLTDDDGTGEVSVGHLDYGEVPRADVAAVLVACLTRPSTIGKTFDVLAGHQPIELALDDL